MSAAELKAYIDKVLGNSIRCLLPSYWWKRLFGLVIDDVEALRDLTGAHINKANSSIKTLEEGYEELEESKANAEKFDMGRYVELGQMEYNTTYLIYGYADNLKIKVWYHSDPMPDVMTNVIWFSNKKTLELISETTISWDGEPTVDFNNLDPKSLYKLEIRFVRYYKSSSGAGTAYIKRWCGSITEYSSSKAKYDTALSDTSTNAVQNKAIKAYVDSKIGGSSVVQDIVFYLGGTIGGNLTQEQINTNIQSYQTWVQKAGVVDIFCVTATDGIMLKPIVSLMDEGNLLLALTLTTKPTSIIPSGEYPLLTIWYTIHADGTSNETTNSEL